jgi:hypothetical protein
MKHIRLTATSSITIAVAATAAATIIPRLGFAHNKPPPLVFAVMEPVDRCLSLGVSVHLDEANPLLSPVARS